MLRDAHNRTIRDLRISVTDRCNFRCFYCKPHGESSSAKRETILSADEIGYLAEIFVTLGIEKIRITGGEPMLRPDLLDIIHRIARLRPNLRDLAMTTNGHGFAEKAAMLRSAGLDRVTVSLDSIDQKNFVDITGVDRLDEVVKAIAAAKQCGLEPVKVNAVIVRRRNDHEVAELAAFARQHSLAMRFIEFMPLDNGGKWERDLVVSGREILAAIDTKFPLTRSTENRGNVTAWRYRFADGSPGEIGIIAPVTDMFCGQCSRIRLTADGQLRTCLFSTTEHDLRGPMRDGASRDELIGLIQNAVFQKEPRHRINDTEFVQPARTMSFIGG